MRFLIDEQLPPGLADRLRAAGHLAEHVRSVGLGGAADGAVWLRAKATKAVILTKDEDLARLAQSEPGVAVVWIRLGNTTKGALWAAIEPHLDQIAAAIAAAERVVEVR